MDGGIDSRMCAIAVKIVRIVVKMSVTVARIAAMRGSMAGGGIGSRTCAIGARIGAIAWKTGVIDGKIGGTAAAEGMTVDGWLVHPSPAMLES